MNSRTTALAALMHEAKYSMTFGFWRSAAECFNPGVLNKLGDVAIQY